MTRRWTELMSRSRSRGKLSVIWDDTQTKRKRKKHDAVSIQKPEHDTHRATGPETSIRESSRQYDRVASGGRQSSARTWGWIDKTAVCWNSEQEDQPVQSKIHILEIQHGGWNTNYTQSVRLVCIGNRRSPTRVNKKSGHEFVIPNSNNRLADQQQNREYWSVDWKWRTWKWRTIKIAGHEIARHEIGGQTTEK